MSVVAREFQPEDAALDLSLRPRTLDDFVGQKRAKEQLSVGLDAVGKATMVGAELYKLPNYTERHEPLHLALSQPQSD